MSVRRLAHAKTRRLTRAEYDRLREHGFFAGEQVELIRGMLVDMTSSGSYTGATAFKLAAILGRVLGDRGKVKVREPIVAADESEPEPDLVVVHPRDPSDILLVVEVADDSLDYDRTTKAWLYAETKIPEYWIVDVAARAVEVFRNPSGEQYDQVDRLDADDTATLSALDGASIRVTELFPGEPPVSSGLTIP